MYYRIRWRFNGFWHVVETNNYEHYASQVSELACNPDVQILFAGEIHGILRHEDSRILEAIDMSHFTE